MRSSLKRETFIALRARRQAYQITSDLINPPIPLEELNVARRPRRVKSATLSYLQLDQIVPSKSLSKRDTLLILIGLIFIAGYTAILAVLFR